MVSRLYTDINHNLTKLTEQVVSVSNLIQIRVSSKLWDTRWRINSHISLIIIYEKKFTTSFWRKTITKHIFVIPFYIYSVLCVSDLQNYCFKLSFVQINQFASGLVWTPLGWKIHEECWSSENLVKCFFCWLETLP